MSDPLSEVRADFDRLAALPESKWDHNAHYHDLLLRQLPARCNEALEIGCGTGAFARRLAGRAAHVTALDLAPAMIDAARQRSAGFKNIDFLAADALAWHYPPEGYDCIVSIATFHHLPLEEILPRLRAALRPGGVLLVLDLYAAENWIDLLVGALAVVVNPVFRLLKTGSLRDPEPVRRFWQEHGRLDHYPTLGGLRRTCADLLPGARLRRLFFFRYLLTWRKPSHRP
jgi:SAM-dependent methyltransferase